MSLADFSWQPALMGGGLIGLAVVLLMLTIGRIAGISSIFASIMTPKVSASWQWAFISGLLMSGVIVHWLYQPIVLEIRSNTIILMIAGLLVGFGARLGSGCTSGHGLCGISRFSPRSITATAVFMSVGMVTVFLLRMFE